MKSKRIIILILLLGLAVRLFFFFVLTPWDRQAFEQTTHQLHSDAAEYNVLALGIWKTNSLSGLGAIRPPAYPLLAAFFYHLFGLGGAWLILIFQIILDLITVYLVYLIGRRISSLLWVGPLAAFLYATSFPTALYSSLLLTEIPFAFFIALTVWLLIRAQKSFWFLAAAGLALGIATLIRPISQYLPVVIVVFWLIVAVCQRKISWRIIGGAALFLFVFVLVISPWLIRNKNVYGYYGLSAMEGIRWDYNITHLKSRIEGTVFGSSDSCYTRELGLHGNPFAASRNCQGEAINYILKNLRYYIPLHLKGTLNIFLGVGRADIQYLLGEEVPGKDFMQGSLAKRIIEEIKISKSQYFLVPILAIRQLLEYLFLLVGIAALLAKKEAREKRVSALLIILFLFYLTILVGPVGYSRFRIPIVPLYLLFSAYGLVFVINKFRTKKAP